MVVYTDREGCGWGLHPFELATWRLINMIEILSGRGAAFPDTPSDISGPSPEPSSQCHCLPKPQPSPPDPNLTHSTEP